ncbi:MAG TPA: DUF4838 domain-containing protein [Terrimicrobiaceae bacterium]|nr:DUF4838 domain-containing protein [Terrimicrobiaceae bacterium]
MNATVKSVLCHLGMGALTAMTAIAAPTELTLVKDGVPAAKIVLPAGPRAYDRYLADQMKKLDAALAVENPDMSKEELEKIRPQRMAKLKAEIEKVGDEELLAAQELQEFLEKMSGAKLEIVEAAPDRIPDGPAILLGSDFARAAGLGKRLDALHKDGLIAVVQGDKLILSGQRARGTLYAAYTFLESLGCRWTMPGKFGEMVPERKTIATALDVTENPSHDERYFTCTYGHTPDYPRWTLRNKGNYVTALGDERPAQSHGMARPLEWGAKRPEYGIKAVRRVLERRAPPGEKPAMVWQFKEIETLPEDFYALVDEHPQLTTPNMSNPKVWQLYADYYIDFFNRNPDKKSVSMSAEDGLVLDERVSSRMLDSKEYDFTAGAPSATDRIWFFLNRVIEKVVKVHPDKKFGMLIYANNQMPPRLEQVHPNMVLVIAPLGISPLHDVRNPKSKTNRAYKEWLEDWMLLAKSSGAEVYYYDYEPLGFSWNMAMICPRWAIIGKNYPWFHKLGLDGYTTQGHDDWGSSGLDNYLMQRLHWNADQDYKAIIKDYSQARFGAAAPAMIEYFDILEKRMEEIPDLYGNEVWSNHLILTPEVRAACRKALDQAVKTADTPQAKAQVETIVLMQKSTDAMCDALEYERETGDYAGAVKKMEPVFEVVEKLNAIYPNFMNAVRMKKDSRRPFETGGMYNHYRQIAERIEAVPASSRLVLPRMWKGMLDTRNHAAALGYQKPDVAVTQLEDLDITVCPDVKYQTQGEVAAFFYRTEVDVPKDFAGKKITLFFPGLIARALQIWINGKPLEWDSAEFTQTTGRATYDVDGKLVVPEKEATYQSPIWRGRDYFWMNYDHRREFDVTPLIRPGEKNTIAFRVFKSFDFGGSYRRPLLLAEAKGEKTP